MSDEDIGRRTGVGADRVCCLRSVVLSAGVGTCECECRPRSVPCGPMIEGAVADSFSLQECSSHPLHLKLDQYTRVLEES